MDLLGFLSLPALIYYLVSLFSISEPQLQSYSSKQFIVMYTLLAMLFVSMLLNITLVLSSILAVLALEPIDDWNN